MVKQILLIIGALLFLMPSIAFGTTGKMMTISYLVSGVDRLKYCNGVDMFSKQYRATINKLETVQIPKQNYSKEDLINEAIRLASGNNLLAIFKDRNFVKIRGDTAYIIPLDGWTGITIYMCYWRPLVEVNLLRVPAVKKIVWLKYDEQKRWDDL